MRILLTTALALMLTACSGAPNYAALPSDPGRVIRVDMSDFAFLTGDPQRQAG